MIKLAETVAQYRANSRKRSSSSGGRRFRPPFCSFPRAQVKQIVNQNDCHANFHFYAWSITSNGLAKLATHFGARSSANMMDSDRETVKPSTGFVLRTSFGRDFLRWHLPGRNPLFPISPPGGNCVRLGHRSLSSFSRAQRRGGRLGTLKESRNKMVCQSPECRGN